MDSTEQSTAEATQAAPVLPAHSEGCTIEDYQLIARIGEGTFGKVWKAMRGGFPVALKILKASMNSEETQRELKSLATLKNLHHQFLLHTENFWSDGDQLFIEMELADGGTLKERLKSYQALGKAGIPEDELLKFFTEAAKALDYLHGHRPVFLHRDVKPANILLVRGCAKIGDFGLLRQVTGDNDATKTQGGTPQYMAPESIKDDRFSVHTDLFSFAITYAELRQGKPPFAAKNQFQIFQKICKDPPELSDIFHPEEKRVLLRAMAKEPAERFSSCGEFVFELNRVVPWVPAVEIRVLDTPPLQEGGTPFFPSATVDHPNTAPRKAPPTKQEIEMPPSTAPRKAPPTRQDIEMPPGTAPRRAQPTKQEIDMPSSITTAARDDGTLRDNRKHFVRPAAEPAIVEAEPHSVTTKPAPIRATPVNDTRPTPAPAPKQSKAGKQTVLTIVAAVVVVAIVAGVSALLTLGPRNPDGNNKKDKNTSDKPPTEKPGPGTDEPTVAAVLRRAEEMCKNSDFKNCLDLLADTKLVFAGEELAGRDRIYERARNGEHARWIQEVRDALKSAAPEEVREKLAVLRDFRKKYGIPAEQEPNFKELPYPNELLVKTWTLLTDKVDAKKARERFDAVKAHTNQSDTFVLDVRYRQNLVAIEAVIKAHESGTDEAITQLLSTLRDSSDPDCKQNLWRSLPPLEKSKKIFRFTNLDALPAAPDDPPAQQARTLLVVSVLDRLVRENNYQWFPSKEEAAKCRTWLSDFHGPDGAVLALKAECLVRLDAQPQEIKAIVLPAPADWFSSYARALVLDANQKPVDAAQVLVGGLKDNLKMRKERVLIGVRILRAAVATLLPKAPPPRHFAGKTDAARAMVWLNLMLDLDQPPTQITVDDFITLASAALKAETADADGILQKAADLLDRRMPADQATGYRVFVQAYLDDVAAAKSGLPQASPDNSVWEQALKKSDRARQFAERALKANVLREAAELYAEAVSLKASTSFAKADADKKGGEMFRVFEKGLDKAKTSSQDKQAQGFVLPVAVAALESANMQYSRDELQSIISEGNAAVDLDLPKEAWWETLRYRGLVRLGDAKLMLVLIKAEANATDYEGIVKLYEKAKTPVGKYAEKYQGELSYKIGALHAGLGNYKTSYRELNEAKAKINADTKSYASEIRRERETALLAINGILIRPELKAVADEK